MTLTAHFSLVEFYCRDGTPVPDEYLGNLFRLATELEKLRAILVGRPIVILSGYRTPTWNKGRGVDKSQHLTASAADIRIAGLLPMEVHDAIERAIARGDMRDGGVGLYLPRPGRKAGWTHYDVRDKPARWRG